MGGRGVELKLSTEYNFEGWAGYPNPPNEPLSGANVYTIITVESSGGNGSDLEGGQWRAIEGHSHQIFSKMGAANSEKNLRTMDWKAHKAFRLSTGAQLHLRQAEAVYSQ